MRRESAPELIVRSGIPYRREAQIQDTIYGRYIYSPEHAYSHKHRSDNSDIEDIAVDSFDSPDGLCKQHDNWPCQVGPE